MRADVENLVKNVHVINPIPQQDMDAIIEIVTSGNVRSTLVELGHGAFGTVYQFDGSDGTMYAVKYLSVTTWTEDNSPSIIQERMDRPHDAHYLEELQGIECFPKLYFYVDGTFQYRRETTRYLIMVSEKVNGYQLAKVRDDHSTTGARAEFVANKSNTLVEQLEASLEKALRRGVVPKDLHQQNVMFDIDKGLAVIVDTGNFNFRNNSMRITSVKDAHQAQNCIEETKGLVETASNFIYNRRRKTGA